MGLFNDYFNPFNPDAYSNTWDFWTEDVPGAVGDTVDSFTGKADRELAEKQIANANSAAEKAALIEKYKYDLTRSDTANQRGIMDRTMSGMEQGINQGAYNAPAFNFDYEKFGLTPPPGPAQDYSTTQRTTQNSLQGPAYMNSKSMIYPNENLSQQQIDDFYAKNPDGDIRDAFTQEQKDEYYSKYPDGDIVESLKNQNVVPSQGTLLPSAQPTSGSNQPDREGTTDIQSTYTLQPPPQTANEGGNESEYFNTPEAPEDFSFTYADFENTPFYQMLQDDSMRGVERSAAARGGLGSGGTMAAIQDRGQAIAGREYGNQYDRAFNTHTNNYGQYQDQRNFDYGKSFDDRGFAYGVAGDDYNRGRNQGLDRFSQQTTLAGLGSPAFQTGVGANQGYASAMGGILGQQANAQNAGYAAMNNANNRFVDNIFKTGGLFL